MEKYNNPLRRTRNFSCATVLSIMGMWFFVGVWRVWFYYIAEGRAEQVVFGLTALWTVLVMNACRDPGWIDEKNVDRYKDAFGEDQNGMVKRAYKSPHSERFVARFDHWFFFFGYDVGALNHIAHHAVIVVSGVIFIVMWFLTIWFYGEMTEWKRWWFCPPIVWEFALLTEYIVEVYLRSLALVFSGASWAVRWYFGDYSWLITEAWAKGNFIWLLYYAPVLLGLLLSYYGMGYCFLFSYHAFLMACGNMTVTEEEELMQKTAIHEETWSSVKGLHFLVWGEIVSVFTRLGTYKDVVILEEGGELPEGFTVLSKDGKWWDGYGTLPISVHRYNRGNPWTNLRELWETRSYTLNPSGTGRLGKESTQAAEKAWQRGSSPASVVVHDGTQAVGVRSVRTRADDTTSKADLSKVK